MVLGINIDADDILSCIVERPSGHINFLDKILQNVSALPRVNPSDLGVCSTLHLVVPIYSTVGYCESE